MCYAYMSRGACKGQKPDPLEFRYLCLIFCLEFIYNYYLQKSHSFCYRAVLLFLNQSLRFVCMCVINIFLRQGFTIIVLDDLYV